MGEMKVIAAGEPGLSGIKKILSEDKYAAEVKKHFGEFFLKKTKADIDFRLEQNLRLTDIIVEKEKIFAGGCGGVNAVLWNMSSTLKTGFDVDMTKITYIQNIIEICFFLKINIFSLDSRGFFIIIKEAPLAEGAAEDLRNRGINAKAVGKLTKEKAKIIRGFDTESCLNRPAKDEIYRFVKE